ncbi:MAG TPA: tetratricopeptide repeat protein [Thermoanaerobaculia bacterium]|nr:tetratricopeptide repeat protein [Thermoanaerobaculia bacterium]
MNQIDPWAASAEKIKLLVESSFATRYDDLEATLEASSLAVALVEKWRNELPEDVVVAAWTQHGNALRLTSRYDEAESMLARAGELPVSDPPTGIHLLSVKASLHRNTGRYESAESLLVSALAAQQPLADPVGLSRIYNLLGICYVESGNRPQAFCAFQTALDLLGQGSPRDVLAATGHNLCHALVAAGRLEAASAALVSLGPLYRGLTSTRLLAKADWMRARLCRALKQLPAAQLAYERAYEILSTGPRSAELAVLVKEMKELPAANWPAPGFDPSRAVPGGSPCPPGALRHGGSPPPAT